MINKRKLSKALKIIATTAGFQSYSQTINDISDTVQGQFYWLGKLTIGMAFVAGIGFLIATIMKFKQFKDNPQQTPIGTPIVMLFIAILLMFLPSMIMPAGETIFGSAVV